jgi:glycerophosphoryl diester phosphodiesterase
MEIRGCATPAAATTGSDVLNYAHRGASAYRPENTLAAFDRAADLGAQYVELDVQRTADGVLVVLHDDTLLRTTNAASAFPDRPSWTVADFTVAELQTLDAGSWFDIRYGGEPIPTLAEVLDLLRRRDLGLLLEAKSPDKFPGIATQIADELLTQRWMFRAGAARLVVESFDADFIREFRTVLPRVTLGLLGSPEIAQLESWSRVADQINPHHLGLTQDYVDAIHEHGMTVNPWTADDPADIARLTALGVEGIITNTPDRI